MYTLNPLKLHTTQHYKCIHNYINYKSIDHEHIFINVTKKKIFLLSLGLLDSN